MWIPAGILPANFLYTLTAICTDLTYSEEESTPLSISKNNIKWVRNSNIGKGWVSWQMPTGESQVPQECKIMDTSQNWKLNEVQVCFVLYGGCIMGTLCFNGPRPESLPPPCAPVRHGKFKNYFISHHSSVPFPRFRAFFLLSWKSDTVFYSFFVSPQLTLLCPPRRILERLY